MANFWYNRGKKLAGLGRITTSADFRLMLVTTCYEGIAVGTAMDQVTVDDGTTSDAKSYELTVGGYARGTVAGMSVVQDDSLDVAFMDATDQTFTSLASGETIGGAVLFIYSSSGGSIGTQTTSDTGQEVVAFYDVTNTPTNGGNITIQWAATSAGGMLKFGSTS